MQTRESDFLRKYRFLKQTPDLAVFRPLYLYSVFCQQYSVFQSSVFCLLSSGTTRKGGTFSKSESLCRPTRESMGKFSQRPSSGFVTPGFSFLVRIRVPLTVSSWVWSWEDNEKILKLVKSYIVARVKATPRS